MKKTIAVVGILVVGLVVGMPYVTGMVAEKTLKKAVVNLNQNKQNGVSEITKVDRGFRNSNYQFSWTPPALLGPEFAELFGSKIEYSCDAKHGMLAINYDCQFDNLESYTEFVKEYLGGKDPLSVTGKVSLFGEVSQEIALDAFSVNEDGESLKVRSGLISILTDANFGEYLIDGEFGGVVVNTPGSNVDIGKMTMDGDIRLEEDGLQTGVFELGFSKLESEEVSMKGGKIKASSQLNNENVDFDYLLSVDQLQSQAAPQPVELDNLKLQFIGNGLDREAMSELNNQMKEIANQGAEMQPQQMTALLPIIESLLKKDLSLWLNMAVDYQKQPMKTDIAMTLLEDTTIAELSVVAYNPEALLDKMQASINMNLPNSVVESVPAFQYQVQSSPLYKQVGDAYQSSLVLQKNNIKLNGESMSFQELLTLVMQSAL